tara:strand:- start:353 stop:721 length:369 start_codon:yes stop_codon:yes gene_type:complete
MDNSIPLEDRISRLINTIMIENFGNNINNNINFISIEVVPIEQTNVDSIDNREIINNLQPYKLIRESDDIIKNKNSCPICLETYEVGKYKRVLPCGHIFHKKCIDKWLKKKLICPICRKTVS